MDLNLNTVERFVLYKDAEGGKRGEPCAVAETEDAVLKYIGHGDADSVKLEYACMDGTKCFSHNKDVYYLRKINYILLEDNQEGVSSMLSDIEKSLNQARAEKDAELENVITTLSKGMQLVSFRGRC